MTIYSLYVKTHKKTGLRYLGYTKQDPQKYSGSGIHWKRHLNIHGNDVITEILHETISHDDIKHWGLYYSEKWNIVESNQWANMKPESGEGGSSPRTKATIEKIRDYQKNKKQWTDKAIKTRNENCIKNAEQRKGTCWSEKHRKARLDNYVEKNIEIFKSIYPLYQAGFNNRQISIKLNLTWDKVKYILKNKDAFLKR